MAALSPVVVGLACESNENYNDTSIVSDSASETLETTPASSLKSSSMGDSISGEGAQATSTSVAIDEGPQLWEMALTESCGQEFGCGRSLTIELTPDEQVWIMGEKLVASHAFLHMWHLNREAEIVWEVDYKEIATTEATSCDLAIDSDGHIYLTYDVGDESVVELRNYRFEAISEHAFNRSHESVHNIALYPSGGIWIDVNDETQEGGEEGGAFRLSRYTNDGFAETDFPWTGYTVSQILSDESDGIYAYDSDEEGGHYLFRFDRAGNPTWIKSPTQEFNTILSLTSRAGDLFIAGMLDDRVLKIERYSRDSSEIVWNANISLDEMIGFKASVSAWAWLGKNELDVDFVACLKQNNGSVAVARMSVTGEVKWLSSFPGLIVNGRSVSHDCSGIRIGTDGGIFVFGQTEGNVAIPWVRKFSGL